MKKTCSIVRHRVDLDGTFSALVVDKWVKMMSHEYEQPEHIGWNYGDPIPELEADTIFLVDISFPPEVMKRMAEKDNVVWIDHHITAIDNSQKYGYDGMKGLRAIGDGACELCWRFLFPKTETPRVIQILSAYDTWQKERFLWKEETLPLQYGLKTKFGLAIAPYTENGVFDSLIDIENYNLFVSVIEAGRTIYEYNMARFKSAVKAYSFEVTVAGKYKGICMMCTDFGSSIYSSVVDDYDIYVCANRKTGKDGKPIFIVSFYSEPGRCDLNLASYAELWGGGGHRCAASCTVSPEDFIKLVNEGKI